jgi:hypothetical protein
VDVADLDLPYAAAPPRLRLDYVAATFAMCLQVTGYGVDGGWSGGSGGELPPGHPLPGLPVPEPVSWHQLSAEADMLAATTEDPDAATLAGLIRRAGELI